MKARPPQAENFLVLQLISPHYNFKVNQVLLEKSSKIIINYYLVLCLNISRKI